jgi:hypothetical protein
MEKILILQEAFCDFNVGFLFYEAQDFGLGDYLTASLRADIERLYAVHADEVTSLAVNDPRRNPEWISSGLNKK